MAKVGISISIDVTKIDKSRLFAGKKGTYLDLTTFVDLDGKDQYDNSGPISQTVTKDEREQRVETPILGNCRVFWKEDEDYRAQAQAAGMAAAKEAINPTIANDDIPF